MGLLLFKCTLIVLMSPCEWRIKNVRCTIIVHTNIHMYKAGIHNIYVRVFTLTSEIQCWVLEFFSLECGLYDVIIESLKPVTYTCIHTYLNKNSYSSSYIYVHMYVLGTPLSTSKSSCWKFKGNMLRYQRDMRGLCARGLCCYVQNQNMHIWLSLKYIHSKHK